MKAKRVYIFFGLPLHHPAQEGPGSGECWSGSGSEAP